VVIERRTRRIVAGVVSASVILGFVACSGSSERRTARGDGGGGDYSSDAGASNGGRNGGGSSSQGGEPAAGAAGSSAGVAGAGGDAGVAGESSLGGESGLAGGTSGAGQASGGEGGAAAGSGGGGGGGEGGSGDVIDPVCGLNMTQVGAYSLWCGKVNMHLTAQNTWTHDADCSSGCNVTGVGYCQKFYPSATKVVAVDQTASVVKDWKNAGCADSTPDGNGISGEAVCCAPLP
jgi:hypothetical protein